MNETAVDALCRDLAREFRLDSKGKGVAALLTKYAANEEDWRPFEHFAEERYTRNLVHRCGDYELLLLCWGPGQESPIHDHAGQRCWMGVLEGELEEVHYRRVGAGADRLAEGSKRQFSKGGVAFIEDEIALHLIRPANGSPGISLHLYARAIDTCRIFDPRTGSPEEVALGYHSVRGVPSSEDPEVVRAAWRGE